MRPAPPPGYLIPAEAARRLGVHRASLMQYARRQLDPLPVEYINGWPCIPEDALERLKRNPYRQRQIERRARALDLIADGVSPDAAARALRVNPYYLRSVARRVRGGARALRRSAHTYNIHETAVLLGVSRETVRLFISEGLLRARQWGSQTGTTKRTYGTTNRRALLAFVRDRRSFLRVSPERISDPVLRAVAAHARDTAGGRWWGTVELGRALGYTSLTMARRMREGRWRGEMTRVGIYWYAWVAEGSDLRGKLR